MTKPRLSEDSPGHVCGGFHGDTEKGGRSSGMCSSGRGSPAGSVAHRRPTFITLAADWLTCRELPWPRSGPL